MGWWIWKRLQDPHGLCLESMQQNAHTLEVSPACLLEDQLLACRRRKYITVWGMAEGWTITNKLVARHDGCYTRLLMMVLELNWKDHPIRVEIYGSFPRVSKVVRERRLNFAAHCSRRQNELVSELIFWMPSQGRPRFIYPKLLSQDTGLESQELHARQITVAKVHHRFRPKSTKVKWNKRKSTSKSWSPIDTLKSWSPIERLNQTWVKDAIGVPLYVNKVKGHVPRSRVIWGQLRWKM